MSEPISGYPMPTDTVHVSMEGRQYRIFNFDLGEGVVRTKILVVAIIVVPWVALLLLIGVSPLGKGMTFYTLVPAVVSWWALRVDAGGRPSYALAWDRLRFWLRRGRPLVPQPGGGDGSVGKAFIVRASWVLLDKAAVERGAGGTKKVRMPWR